MSVNSVHQNIEALKGWLLSINKDKKNNPVTKGKYTNKDTKAKK
jgi:hypothetical protein